MRVPRLVPEQTIKSPPTPTATAPGPEAFGGIVASALSQSGAQLTAHAERMQQEKDAIKGLHLTAQAQKRLTEALYGEDGLMLKQGLDADGVYKRFEDLHTEIIDEIIADAENDNQRSIVIQSMLRQLPGYQSQLAKHEAAELQKAKVQELQANLASLSETAIASLGDPETMATVSEEIERVAVALGGSYGEEFVMSMIDETMDNIHSGIISKLLANDALEAAKDYYEKNKDEISTASQTKIEEFFTKKESVIFTQEKGYEIFQKFGLNNEAKALAYIRENYSGEKENALMSYVQGLYVDERRFKEERESNYRKSLINRVWSSQSMAEAIKIVEDSNLDYATKRQLINQIRSDYMGTDIGQWESIKAMEEIMYRATRPEGHPDAFKDEADMVMSFGGRLTKAQQQTVYKAWQMRNTHQRIGDSIDDAMSDYNIPEGLYPQFANDVYDAVNSRETAEKRTLGDHEIEEAIRDVVQKNKNLYLHADYSRTMPSEITAYIKDKYKMTANRKEYSEFKEAYLEYLDAMGGSTGIAAVKPTTLYDLADALLQDVPVSQGFFRKRTMKGYELHALGAVLREAPDGTLQWYINDNGVLVPVWEVLGGLPVD